MNVPFACKKTETVFKSSHERKMMRLGVRRPGSIPSSGTNEPWNDSNNYNDDSGCPSLSILRCQAWRRSPHHNLRR